MKLAFTFFLFIISSITSIAKEIDLTIQANWQFQQVGKTAWLPATVPGTVHTDLLKNGEIEEPHFGTNGRDLQWIEREDWEYKTTFLADGEIITKDKIVLDFHGLDTYADVYLNDSLILVSNNMFRSWEVSVSSIIRSGENELRIYFHSPIKKTEPIYESLGYTLPVTSADQADKKLSVFSRKTPYHFGSNSSPRFVTSGIWKPITLRAWDTAQLKDAYLVQKSLSDEEAKLLANLEYEATRPFVGELEILIDGKSVKTSTVDLRIGIQKDNISMTIDNPELWWPNGLGNQKLYNIEVRLKKAGDIVDSRTIQTGLRTVELVQDKDNEGHSFYFRVNGRPVFIKGANYVPQDNFLPSVTPGRYEHLLQSAIDANMNMVRVWGGGIYENDLFYELCDQKGLLVWQDFIFSGAMYPVDSSFLENVREEAKENVARLRHHPSLALWCGNDEILMQWQKWKNNTNPEGNQTTLWTDKKASISMVNSYQKLFKDILPTAVKNYSQGVPYWESSPSAMNGAVANTNSGDQHYWSVGQGKEPFEAYQKNIGRFISAYGFPSLPEIKTIGAFAKAADWDLGSEPMQAHQGTTGNYEMIKKYMADNFREPMDFEGFLYLSQLLQAQAAKMAIEAHRMNKPTTMGSLIWQLNESWPGASPSGVDYFGRWKAQQYYTKRAFADVIIAFEAKRNELKIHGISDLYEDQKALLTIELVDLNGKTIVHHEKKPRLKANANSILWKGSKAELLKKQKTSEIYLRAKLVLEDGTVTESTHLFVPLKKLSLEKPDIKYDFEEKGGKLFVKLSSNKTAFGVCFDSKDLDLLYSDNYFTLHTKTPKLVEIKTDISHGEIKNKLTVKSLADSYGR